MKFQVSRDTLGAMLRSMAYIREQLSNAVIIPESLIFHIFHFAIFIGFWQYILMHLWYMFNAKLVVGIER